MKFHISDILTITTGRLVSTRHIDGVYSILNFMTGDNLYSHQLPRAMQECKPWLLRQIPELVPCGVPGSLKNLDGWMAKAPTCPSEGIKMWLTELKLMFPKLRNEYEVQPIPRDDHERKDPFSELVEMVGADRVVVAKEGE